MPPVVQPPPATPPTDDVRLERPFIGLVPEGTAVKPLLRLVGRVDGKSIHVPCSDRARALAALDQLLPAFFQSAAVVAPPRKDAADEPVPEPTLLEAISAKLDVVITAQEQFNAVQSDTLDVLKALADGEPAEPPGPPEPPSLPRDPWADAFSLGEEPPGLDQPMTSFDPVEAIRRAVFARNPINGSSYASPEHARALDAVRAIYYASSSDEIADPVARAYFDACMRTAPTAVDLDVCLYAPLVGLVHLTRDGFAHPIGPNDPEILQLAGTHKQDGFRPLTLEGAWERVGREGGPAGSPGYGG